MSPGDAAGLAVLASLLAVLLRTARSVGGEWLATFPPARAAWLVPVVATGLLVCVDLAAAVAPWVVSGTTSLDHTLAPGAPGSGLCAAVSGALVRASTTAITSRWLLPMVVPGVPGWLPDGASAAVTAGVRLALLGPIPLLLRGIARPPPSDGQPPGEHYLWRQAARDWLHAWHRTWERTGGGAFAALRAGPQSTPRPAALLVAALLPGGILLAAPAALALGLAFLGQALLLGAAWATLWSAVAGLALGERAQRALRSAGSYCTNPEPGCSGAEVVPELACPRDHSHRYTGVTPGRMGILAWECHCGGRLPTLDLYGRAELVSYCPRCGARLAGADGRGSVHVPCYGRAAAGKTTFLAAAVSELRTREFGAFVSVPRIESQAARLAEWGAAIRQGRFPAPTHDRRAQAAYLDVQRRGGLRVGLFLYDAAGESARDRNQLALHRNLEHARAMLLLIDPLAPPFLPGPGGSQEHEVTAIQQAFRLARRLDAGRPIPVRVAVVVGKLDNPEARRSIGVAPPERGSPAWDGGPDARSAAVREALYGHAPNLVANIEREFAEVRWFPASVPGSAAPGEAFAPTGVLEAVLWAASASPELARPAAARVRARAAQAALLLLCLTPILTVLLAAPLLLRPAWVAWQRATFAETAPDDPPR